MSNPQQRSSNRLSQEKSPYLLQHADNPVDWWPWCAEAFAAAKAEDKLVFLSIGYSTCHWCHVMAHQSFEDQQVADCLNQHYISIKVDREERPDIDAVYMQLCQAMTGSGGWPLTALLLPDMTPFFVATYLPKEESRGQMGLLDLLNQVNDSWHNSREQIEQRAAQIRESIINHAPATPNLADAPLSRELVERAYSQLKSSFQPHYGGFSRAPKFPMPHTLMLLLRYYQATGEEEALTMVETTLQQMIKGGIFDHIGWGFCRYATDSRWLAPHFEKMLYDNALLIIALLETYQLTKKDLYRQFAEKTLCYIRREMTSAADGFFSAQDADSEGSEGKYYLWSVDEVKQVLGEEDGAWFCQQFDISVDGNFEGKNIPNLINNNQAFDIQEQALPMYDKLYQYRLWRMPLHKDDKVLTSWNALMIVAHVKAYSVLGKEGYLQSAKRALSFIEENLLTENQLQISWREGEAKGAGLLDDYAFLAWAYLELHQSTEDKSYLEQAESVARTAISDFADSKGGFFMTSARAEKLLFRPQESYDGALPSGNSVMGSVLLHLASLTKEPLWQEEWDKQLGFLADNAAEQPLAHTFALISLLEYQAADQQKGDC